MNPGRSPEHATPVAARRPRPRARRTVAPAGRALRRVTRRAAGLWRSRVPFRQTTKTVGLDLVEGTPDGP